MQSRYNTTTIDRIRRVTSNITATDLENCEIVKLWKDKKARVGARGTIYALARIGRQDASKAIQKAAAGTDLQDREQELLGQIVDQLKGGL